MRIYVNMIVKQISLNFTLVYNYFWCNNLKITKVTSILM